MGAIGHDGLAVPGKVDLAHEPAFRLGILEVEPSTRQLKSATRSETLEPRVMQVLVALFRFGDILTKDDLILRCWDGRVVGDDAINRVLSRIRHVAADIGHGSFSVETITKVGYRLHATEVAGEPAGKSHDQGSQSGRSRRNMMLAAGAAGAAVLVGLPLAWRSFGSKEYRQAEEFYQRALTLRGSASPEDNRQAIAYLREAVRIAPDHGAAWGGLAYSYRSALLGGEPDQAAGLEARLQESLRQADRHDPGNADAAIARRLQGHFFGRWETMEPVYRELASRFPRHPTGHYLLGSLLMDVGRWNEAVDALRIAKVRSALAPFPRYKLTVALWSAGRISDAEREIDDAMRWSVHSSIWQTKVKLLAMTGRTEAALAVLNDASGRPADTTEEHIRRWRLFLAAMSSRLVTDVDRAMEAIVSSARQIAAPVPEAFQCAMLGRTEPALAILEGCYLGIGEWADKRPADPTGNVAHPLFQPQAESLWTEPRFTRLLDGIGLERYWRAAGRKPDYRLA